MDLRKIKTLITLVKETGVGEIEVTSGEESVRISLHPAPGQAAAHYVAAPATATAPAAPAASADAAPNASTVEPDGYCLKSPMVGTAYLSATPGDPPFVQIGQHVKKGDTLCLIEAMKMFNKIEADRSGIVSARLVENEQPVEFDQTLFIIDEDG